MASRSEILILLFRGDTYAQAYSRIPKTMTLNPKPMSLGRALSGLAKPTGLRRVWSRVLQLFKFAVGMLQKSTCFANGGEARPKQLIEKGLWGTSFIRKLNVEG